jgi:hypothetical protein
MWRFAADDLSCRRRNPYVSIRVLIDWLSITAAVGLPAPRRSRSSIAVVMVWNRNRRASSRTSHRPPRPENGSADRQPQPGPHQIAHRVDHLRNFDLQ